MGSPASWLLSVVSGLSDQVLIGVGTQDVEPCQFRGPLALPPGHVWGRRAPPQQLCRGDGPQFACVVCKAGPIITRGGLQELQEPLEKERR